MDDKGHQLFLNALQLRFHCKYQEARRAFEEAAQHGSGDACWYIYVTDEIGGLCFLNEESEAFDYLARGTKLGHLVCTAVHHVVVVDPNWKKLPTPPSLAAEIQWWQMFPDEEPRTFSASEVAIIQKAAEQAILIHDVYTVSIYFDYVVLQKGMMQFVDPCLIAHALCLFDDDEGMVVQYRRNGLYRDFDYRHVIEKNHFNLSEETLFVIKCIVGKLLIKQDDQTQSDYIDFYRHWKALVDQRILAWMGCFRRKKLTWLSRDTATLIAKMMANPVYWTKIMFSSVYKKKIAL